MRGGNVTELIAVPSDFLTPGESFFAQLPDGIFSNCQYGLRLHIKVKDNDCNFDPKLNQSCSNHGKCVSSFASSAFSCDCDFGHQGRYCEEYDGCALTPCMLGGKCQDVEQGLLGRDYNCSCSETYSGKPFHFCHIELVLS